MSDTIIKTLKAEKAALAKSISPILAKISGIDELLKLYSDTSEIESEQKNPKQEVFDFGGNSEEVSGVANIIKATLRQAGHVVKAQQFYVPVYKTEEPTKDQKNNISSSLNALRRAGEVERYKENNNNNLTYWGLSEWFEGELPKEKYKGA